MLSLLTALAAAAGYGDVDDNGLPSWGERDMHLWTNAVRVDPAAFESEYARGGCSQSVFSTDELTAKAPLYYSRPLNDAARYHAEDMYDSGNFSHSSSDGTSFADRIASYYDETYTIGENIAYGYADTRAVVLEGWMCSGGHRENIMSDAWVELGTGVAHSYYTQDFAAGTADSTSPVAMGAHEPEALADDMLFLADWQDDAPPAKLQAVLDGENHDLSLLYGTDTQGIYGVELTPSLAPCQQYWFRWETEDGTRGAFPEEGSYLVGDCDSETMWTDSQRGRLGEEVPGLSHDDDDDDAPSSWGCQAVTPASAGMLVGLLAVFSRRRAGDRR